MKHILALGVIVLVSFVSTSTYAQYEYPKSYFCKEDLLQDSYFYADKKEAWKLAFFIMLMHKDLKNFERRNDPKSQGQANMLRNCIGYIIHLYAERTGESLKPTLYKYGYEEKKEEESKFASIAPCDPEQYVAPAPESERRLLQENFDEDLRLAFQAVGKNLVLRILCRAAAAGIVDAELRLGLVNIEGHGFFEKDEVQARYWLRRAANKNHNEAQFALSVLYREGRGGPPLGKEGMRLLTSAAKAGVPEALLDLASEYAVGRYIFRDLGRARFWAELAKDAGLEEAEEFLLELAKALRSSEER